MGIETAFVIGLIVGQWLMLWILWRASLKVLKIMASIETGKYNKSSPGSEIIYGDMNDVTDNDL